MEHRQGQNCIAPSVSVGFAAPLPSAPVQSAYGFVVLGSPNVGTWRGKVTSPIYVVGKCFEQRGCYSPVSFRTFVYSSYIETEEISITQLPVVWGPRPPLPAAPVLTTASQLSLVGLGVSWMSTRAPTPPSNRTAVYPPHPSKRLL